MQTLQARGYRVTRPRRMVLQSLEEAARPVSPHEIQSALSSKGGYLDRVTIYRVLDLFCRLNLAHRLPSSGGFVKCSLGEKGGCHRFVVCRQCGAFQEFADEALCREESKLATGLDFHAERHFSETSGICSSCYELRQKALLSAEGQV
ncbi:MAG: transcriptional repressor [Dehalococcoidia bacterium]|nr:transcriptional repressor [Dehalococcoidia bacterium]